MLENTIKAKGKRRAFSHDDYKNHCSKWKMMLVFERKNEENRLCGMYLYPLVQNMVQGTSAAPIESGRIYKS
jgi:hypothetical protein